MNLPNKLTVFRVLLVPVFVLIYYSNIANSSLIAAIVFIIASLTDLLDGYIARKYNLVTNFGKFMDPLADKILVAAALILFVESGTVPGWVLMVVIAREFIVSGIRLVAANNNITIAAGNLGKLKTATQMVSIVMILMNNFPLGMDSIRVDMILLYISTILTVISGIEYVILNKDVIGSSNN